MDNKRKIEEVDMSKIIQIDEIVSPIKKLRLCIDEDYDYIKMLENKIKKDKKNPKRGLYLSQKRTID